MNRSEKRSRSIMLSSSHTTLENFNGCARMNLNYYLTSIFQSRTNRCVHNNTCILWENEKPSSLSWYSFYDLILFFFLCIYLEPFWKRSYHVQIIRWAIIIIPFSSFCCFFSKVWKNCSSDEILTHVAWFLKNDIST